MKNFISGVFSLLSNFFVLSSKYGSWRSISSRMAVDAMGDPIPWYTYPAIEYLSGLDFGECDVFEFGSGNSSYFWSRRAREVTSVEDDINYFNSGSCSLNENQTLIYRGGEIEYIAALTEKKKKYDVILIDGNHRLAATRESIRWIKSDGIILLDNSDRAIERECSRILRENNYIQIDFSGFGPINGYCWTTSIFFKCSQRILNTNLGPNPLGGICN